MENPLALDISVTRQKQAEGDLWYLSTDNRTLGEKYKIETQI